MTREEFTFKGIQAGDVMLVNEWKLTFLCKGGSANQYWVINAEKDGAQIYTSAKKTLSNWKDIIFGAEEGKAIKVTIPAKVDNSQAHGEHKVVSVKLSTKKEGVKAEQLVNQALELLQCSDSKKAAVLSAFNSALLQHERCMNEALQFAADKKKAEAEAEKARKQAELAAKKKAEAEAKRQAEERAIMINFLIINKGMSRSDAEEFLG